MFRSRNRAIRCLFRIAAALGVMALQATARAGYDEGMAAGRRGDYASALRELRPLAESGEPSAQLAVADMYPHGWGVPEDDSVAIAWYQKAAAHGDPRAQTDLGWLYEQGRGVPRDFERAVSWYRNTRSA